MYSNGVSESIIGSALKHYKIPRKNVVILTKCCFGANEAEPGFQTPMLMGSMMATKEFSNAMGLSRNAIFEQVDASLRRLGTDYIDLLQIHRFDPTVPPEETMKALHDLVQSGKVRYIGASSMWAYQFATMQFIAEKHGWTKFVSMQGQYSLLYREEEREMNKFCKETGVGLIPWSPLAGGALSRPLNSQPTVRSETKGGPPKPKVTEADKEITKRVEEIAKKKGYSMAQVAVLWAIQKGCTPIIGFSKVERLDDGCGVKGKSLSEEEMKYLEEPYVTKAVMGHM